MVQRRALQPASPSVVAQYGKDREGTVDAKVREIVGDLEQVKRELQAFSETAELLSQPEIFEQYKGEWVALYDSRVCAHAATLDDILRLVDEQGLPRRNTLVDFIDDGTVNLILHVER